MKLIKTTVIITFTIFCFLILLSSSSTVVDFCVADFNFPLTPKGYPCKNPANVTVDDFVLSSLNTAPEGTTNSLFNISSTLAIDKTIPGLNGLGLSLVKFNFGVGGAAPMHSHQGPEIILVTEGTFVAGFIASDNTPYYKTLNKGDVMILPPSLLHFQVNVGDVPGVLLCTFDTAFNPNFQSTTPSLGGNDLPTEVIQKTTLLDFEQVKKLKKIFGGTN